MLRHGNVARTRRRRGGPGRRSFFVYSRGNLARVTAAGPGKRCPMPLLLLFCVGAAWLASAAPLCAQDEFVCAGYLAPAGPPTRAAAKPVVRSRPPQGQLQALVVFAGFPGEIATHPYPPSFAHVNLRGNPLDQPWRHVHIPALQARGVQVTCRTSAPWFWVQRGRRCDPAWWERACSCWLLGSETRGRGC
jgi:hypothetical protein